MKAKIVLSIVCAAALVFAAYWLRAKPAHKTHRATRIHSVNAVRTVIFIGHIGITNGGAHLQGKQG